MASLNKVFMIGNLTRDPELRYTPSGAAVASFGLAANREWATQQGEKRKETCFVKIVVWGRTAELCGEYLYKGSQVFVEGRLQYRTWEETGGAKRSTLEVRAERVQFLGKPKAAAGAQAAQPPQAEEVQNIDLNSDMGIAEAEKGPEPADKDVPF